MLSLRSESCVDKITIRRKGKILLVHPNGNVSNEQWKRAILFCAWDLISVHSIWNLEDIGHRLVSGELHALNAVRSSCIHGRGYGQRFVVAGDVDGNILARAFQKVEPARWKSANVTIVRSLEEIPMLCSPADVKRWPRIALL